ncbi:MAG: 50S ribosomal protein L5 [Dehalococcoidia bacterium]
MAEQKTQRKARSKAKEAREKASPTPEAPARPRFQELYRRQVLPALLQEFGLTNPMAAPRIQKVALNIGLGEALTNAKAIESASEDLAAIAGQRPVVSRARKAIASFKLRAGMPIGVHVTLRGRRMWYFLERLLTVALPRIRDFRGVSRASFDGRGNYSLGIREQVIFPEIDYNKIDKLRGFQVTITTTAQDDRQAQRLLELLGMPFAREH